MKILIVDDARVMRNIHRNALLDHKINDEDIFEAGDGTIALGISKEKNIDLFLVDWNMPGLNGLDFVKEIRAMDKYKSAPIIMITSEAAKYMVMDAINAGVTNYIVKPVKDKVLSEKLAKYIK